MNIFFVKNEKVAFLIDPEAVKTKKDIWQCCPFCGNSEPIATVEGWLVKTSLKRSQLKKQGIIVSSAH